MIGLGLSSNQWAMYIRETDRKFSTRPKNMKYHKDLNKTNHYLENIPMTNNTKYNITNNYTKVKEEYNTQK